MGEGKWTTGNVEDVGVDAVEEGKEDSAEELEREESCLDGKDLLMINPKT
jgi:hypothetical protein